MQRKKVDVAVSGSPQQEAQDEMEDQRRLIRRTILASFAAFGAIVLALRVGTSRDGAERASN